MNEQQNVAILQKAFAAFGRGDIDGILEACADDAEFHLAGPPTIPFAGTKKGKGEIRTYFETLIGTQQDANLRIDEFVAQNNTVVAIGHYSAKIKATGKPIDTPLALSYHMQDGKIKEHRVFGDTAALADGYTATRAAVP